MSATFNTSRELQQIEFGVQDVAATVSVATSLWQWTGGLSGIRTFLTYLPNAINPKLPKELGFQKRAFQTSCAILTPTGLFHAHPLDNSDQYFSGDVRTQLVGLTICALAHLFDDEFAISMFMRCVAPALLTGQSGHGVREAFHAQLTNNSFRILNEGAAYGLPAIFEDAISGLDLPPALHDINTPDHAFVGGLLKWMVQPKRRRYVTRSATVARVAACLDRVGWTIGPIEIWGRPDPVPPAFDGVTLVIAGSFATDPLMLEDDELQGANTVHAITHHYTNRTVGSMIYVVMGAPNGISPEALQSDFESINRSIRTRLSFSWNTQKDNRRSAYTSDLDEILLARPHWSEPPRPANRISVRLATLRFGAATAEHVAIFFQDIATEPILQEILAFLEVSYSVRNDLPLSVRRFNAIVICIMLSVAEVLGGKGYMSLRHSTQLGLYSQWDAVPPLAERIFGIMKDLEIGLPMRTVVGLLSIFHCGREFSRNFEDVEYRFDNHLIGFKNGDYSVLPALMYEMEPRHESLGFRCGDIFLANIATRPDGCIYSSPSDTWSSIPFHGSLGSREGHSQDIDRHLDSFVAPPLATPPDRPLYLNFERPYENFQKDQIVLAGRIGGELIGFSGIRDVLITLTSSLAKRVTCDKHHEVATSALVFKPSAWMQKRYKRPMDESRQLHTYVPVKDDACWALFLAGQVASIEGRICFGCFECNLEREGVTVYVGYM